MRIIMLDLHMRRKHISGMTLDAYITANALTEPEAARRFGVDQSTINRLRKGQIPSSAVMKRIAEVTDKAVTPNDFFGIERATACEETSA